MTGNGMDRKELKSLLAETATQFVITSYGRSAEEAAQIVTFWTTTHPFENIQDTLAIWDRQKETP